MDEWSQYKMMDCVLGCLDAGVRSGEDGPIDVAGVLGLLALRSSQLKIGRARGVHLVGPKSLEGH